MYQYTDFDRQFVHARAAQFRDQLERNLAGELSDDDFRPLRLQNGWYIQRHAPMLRVAVPYGEIRSSQLRQLARIATELDRGFAHFTTRQNVQFNWIPIERSADAMDLLADADLHGIQTSGNCIRNITSDAFAGIAPDEVVDPRPYCEVLRQWSTLHPEFAFLPRKFKIAVSGAREDRAAIKWHDIGLQLVKDEHGDVGFQVWVGGGMGRTPVIATLAAEFDRVAAHFQRPAKVHPAVGGFDPNRTGTAPVPFLRWLDRNVHGHQVAGYRAVTLSLKRAGQAPGDVTSEQLEAAAVLADRYSLGEARVTHDQNLVLPWVREADLFGVWFAAREHGFATPNIGLLTDMIACPGGDFCALANARSLPIAAAITEQFDDLDALLDLGDIDLHMSGCMNSCGHHHTGHIGILGIDKDGDEWYQVSIGGSDGSTLSGAAVPGKVIGPSFSADEVPEVIQALIDTYRAARAPNERFVDAARRLGVAPFRAAADAVRRDTAVAA